MVFGCSRRKILRQNYVSSAPFTSGDNHLGAAKSKAKLIVTASRLDAAVPTATGGSPWGGWLEESQQVIVNIRFPTSGCWRVTARYEDQEITFTVWVPE
jgi:hypothetical protein